MWGPLLSLLGTLLVVSELGAAHSGVTDLEAGHHDGSKLEAGHHDWAVLEAGHHDGSKLEAGHHDWAVLEAGHHDRALIEAGHHDKTGLDAGHYDGNKLYETHHHRTKRYLVFPEGSTFSWAFCMTIKALTPDVDIFSEAVAVAVSYELPHNATVLRGSAAPETQRQHRAERRSIYRRAESILERLGVPGPSCVLRTICEGAQELDPGEGILQEILRIVLLFPEGGAAGDEPKDQWRYLAARRAGLRNNNCPDLYPECPISIIGIIRTLTPE